MNAHRLLLTFWFVAAINAVSVRAAETDRRFLREVGSLSQSDTQVRTVVTAAASADVLPNVTVTWRAGDDTDSNSKQMIQAGWFVFVEQPSRVWVFDGKALSMLQRQGRIVSDTTSAEAFKSCPQPVKDALPEKIRKRYFK